MDIPPINHAYWNTIKWYTRIKRNINVSGVVLLQNTSGHWLDTSRNCIHSNAITLLKKEEHRPIRKLSVFCQLQIMFLFPLIGLVANIKLYWHLDWLLMSLCIATNGENFMAPQIRITGYLHNTENIKWHLTVMLWHLKQYLSPFNIQETAYLFLTYP